VADAFDLNLIPLYRVKGQEWPQLPGLLATLPPKRAARGRESDALVIYLTLVGNAAVSSADYTQISVQMAQRFYQSPGSLTSAMRTTAEVLNQYLVERNMRSTSQGQYLIGRLIISVLREGQLTLAQCGPTRVFHLTGGGSHPIHDPNTSGRGLGISQSTPLYFAQAEIHAGDRLVLCTYCPEGWETALPVQNAASLNALRRGLFAATGDDLNAVLLEIQSGNGDVTILQGDRTTAAQPVSMAAPVPAPAPAPVTDSPLASIQPQAPAAQPENKNEAGPLPTRLDLTQPGRFVRPLGPRPDEAPPATPPAPAPEAGPVERSEPAVEHKGRFVAPREQPDIPEIVRARSARGRGLSLGLAQGLRGIRLFFEKISGSLKKLLPRLLPTLQEDEAPRAGSAMLLVAIAVPLVVVTAAVIVYMKFGQGSQYKTNYEMAVSAAVEVIGQDDPAIRRAAWERTLDYLDKAEGYQVTPESQALRQQAQAALDGSDGILRLDFRPAISGGLDRSVKVVRMAATGADLYMLDSTRGGILRAFLTSQGYEMDPAFQCSPGTYGEQPVGALIDLAAMPGGNLQNAAIVAMDASGTLLYCAPEMDPLAFPLAVPELGWQTITGFTLSASGRGLYALDSKAVWVYGYDVETGKFIDPIAFFGEQVPRTMGQAVDLAVNGSDLFLLFEDGHMAVCTFSRLAESKTTCLDPATFLDGRAGHQPGPTITDAVFSQVMFDAPFNTSLYLLEPNTQAIYKFSPRPSSLELGGQFHAGWEMEAKQFQSIAASAMAIDTNRTLFLCVGNQVYFAAMP